jgi:hypothetical protein
MSSRLPSTSKGRVKLLKLRRQNAKRGALVEQASPASVMG